MNQQVQHQDILCFRYKTEGIYRPQLKSCSTISQTTSLTEHNSEAQSSVQRSLNTSSLKSTEQFSFSNNLLVLLKSSKAFKCLFHLFFLDIRGIVHVVTLLYMLVCFVEPERNLQFSRSYQFFSQCGLYVIKASFLILTSTPIHDCITSMLQLWN